MKKITIGFSKPNKLKIGAELIMWWTNAPYSHVYIRYEDNEKRDMVFESAHGNVHPILYKNFIIHNFPVNEYHIEFTEEEYQKMRTFYYNKMGEPYSYPDLIVIVVHDILNKIGINFNSSHIPGYVCSEFVATMLSEIKGYVFKKPLNLMRPDDLYVFLNEKSLAEY